MKLTKQQLKQTIKEELGSLDRAILDQLKLIVSSLDATNKKLENIDTSLDFVGGALTGQDPLAIGMGHNLVGRWQPRPSAVRSAAEPEVNETSTKGKHKMKLTKQQLKKIIKEELEAVLSDEGNPEINYEGTKTNIELLGMETKHDQTEVKLRINGEEHALLGAYDIDSLADGVIAKIEDGDDYWFLGEYGDADLESEFHGLLERTLEALGADPASASQDRGSYRDRDTGGHY